jgi:hypothetical protein
MEVDVVIEMVVAEVVVVVGTPLQMYSQLENRALGPVELPTIRMPLALLYTHPLNCISFNVIEGVPVIPRYAAAVTKHSFWSTTA